MANLKQKKFNRENILASKYFLMLLCLCGFGCSSWWTVAPPKPNPNVYHIGEHGWSGDSIYFRVYRTSDPSAKPGLRQAEVDCKSCNIIQAPVKAEFDESGMTRIYIPDALQMISARLNVSGDGIDTTFIQTQRPPQQAMEYFKLSKPLTGRVMIAHFAVLYFDTTMDSVGGTAEVGDELNTFTGHSFSFYLVHDPNFGEPLYLLKDDAVRLY